MPSSLDFLALYDSGIQSLVFFKVHLLVLKSLSYKVGFYGFTRHVYTLRTSEQRTNFPFDINKRDW